MEEFKKRRAVVEQYVGKPIESSGKLNQVMGLLEMFGRSPAVAVDYVTADPFASGGFHPLTKQVQLSPRVRPENREAVATHEYVHALDNMMMNQAQRVRPSSRLAFGLFDKSYSPEAKQFAEGYAKLTDIGAYMPSGLALQQNAYSPDKLSTRGMSPYRASGSEQRAWGVSEQIKSESPGNPHLDATRASEFDILMDLLSRSNLNKKEK